MGGKQSINLCVHILGPHEAGAGWQPRQRDAGAAGTRATSGRPPSTLAEVTEFTALGHAPAPAHRPLVLSRGAPRGPAGRRGTGPVAAARDRGAARGPPSATRGRRSAARSAEQCAAAPPLTSHVAVQAARRGPDCPGHCGIATPGCPPRERELAGSGSREHGERPDSTGAAPAPGAPRPAREARKVRRKVRVSCPACSSRSSASPGTWKAKGGKEACTGVGGYLSQHSQFWSSARKLIVTQTQTQATFLSYRQIKLAV